MSTTTYTDVSDKVLTLLQLSALEFEGDAKQSPCSCQDQRQDLQGQDQGPDF